MRKILVVSSSLVVTLLLAIGAWTSSSAQSAPWQVVQAGDGMLYLLADGVRYSLIPDPIGDEELAEIPDGGPVGGQLLGLPLEPTVVPVPATVEPTVVPPTPTPQVIILIATPTPEPMPTSTPIPPTPITPTAIPALAAEQPSTVSGIGLVTSPRFSIRGGDYIVSWSFSPGAKSSCFAAGAGLHAADGSGSTRLGSTAMDIPPGQSAGGEMRAYNLVGGQYYATGSTTCNWSVTIRPQ
jgi:hypothetical protein